MEMAVDIVLDAGHGGFDNGASYMGRAEKDDVLRLTQAVGKDWRRPDIGSFTPEPEMSITRLTKKPSSQMSQEAVILSLFIAIPAWKIIFTTVYRHWSINRMKP